MSAVPSSPVVKSWQAAFDAQLNVGASQREAFAAFLTRGLPTTKLDAWKYTDLRRLAMRQFRLPSSNSTQAPVDELLLPLKGSHRFVFVDGVLAPSVQPLRTTVAPPSSRADAFDLLNAALSSDSVQIRVADDQVTDSPIYLAFVWTKESAALMMHPRVQLSLGRNSKATLIEHHIGLNTEANFTNAVIDIAVGDHAALEHIRVQDDAVVNFNISNVHATV
ncbi:MAG: SufD family Fe-S cluster assembly protein, partial [Candidatus Obscuribacterales bacterium]|nr:SufD family Fe-S cluster assembly protein [Steroidobacteraceae bacterium]